MLNAQRQLTDWFIRDDPTIISLIPAIESTTPGGHKSYVDGTPRAAQVFKLSLLSADQRPLVTVSGVERRADYHLIGAYDAVVEVGDHWTDDRGTKYEVVAMVDGHDYEVKALVYRHVPREANI